MGVDGTYTFENAHGLVFPLVAAAPVCSLDLLTNIAIAFPRSPLHLATAGYDLQLLSEGRFRHGLGSQVKAHIEKCCGARWGNPLSRTCGSGCWRRRRSSNTGSTAPGSTSEASTPPTPHDAGVQPGSQPARHSKILVGALGPKMNEIAAEVAVGILVMPFNSGRHMAERTVPAIERGLAAPDAAGTTSRSRSR